MSMNANVPESEQTAAFVLPVVMQLHRCFCAWLATISAKLLPTHGGTLSNGPALRMQNYPEHPSILRRRSPTLGFHCPAFSSPAIFEWATLSLSAGFSHDPDAWLSVAYGASWLSNLVMRHRHAHQYRPTTAHGKRQRTIVCQPVLLRLTTSVLCSQKSDEIRRHRAHHPRVPSRSSQECSRAHRAFSPAIATVLRARPTIKV